MGGDAESTQTIHKLIPTTTKWGLVIIFEACLYFCVCSKLDLWDFMFINPETKYNDAVLYVILSQALVS